MAELFEEVVVLLESRSSTRALARRFRIESQQAASNGAVLCIPLFVSELHRWAADQAKAASLLKTLRSIDTSGLDDPGATIEGGAYDPTGTNLTDKLFGHRRHSVATAIANEAGISVQGADHLLAPTGWAFVAVLVDRYGNRMDRQSLMKILDRELDELLEADWGPWMDIAGRDDTSNKGVGFLGRSRNPSRESSSGGGSLLSDQSRGDYSAYDDHGDYGPYGQNDRDYASAYGADQEAYFDDLDRYGEPEDYDTPGPFGFGGAATSTGELGLGRRSLAAAQDEVEAEAAPSQIPLILAAVAVGLLAILGLSQVLGGDDDGSDATAAIGVDDATQDLVPPEATVSDTAPLAEPVAMTLSLIDPLSASAATGQLQLRFNPQDGEICFNVAVDAMPAPFDGHIHAGPAGQTGEVVLGLGLLNNGDIGCAEASPQTQAQLLNDRANHYVDLHGSANVASIRAQLSEGVEAQDSTDVPTGPPALVYEPRGTGAALRLESGRLVLFGEVADQATLDQYVGEYADLGGPDLEVVSEVVVAAGAPAPSGRIIISNNGLFQVGGDQLSPDRGTVINDLALLLQNRPDWTATVVGHTDSTGSEGLNLDLSLRRATAVLNELVANGVAAERLGSDGAGSSQPIADNSTSAGQAENRRIELIVVRG